MERSKRRVTRSNVHNNTGDADELKRSEAAADPKIVPNDDRTASGVPSDLGAQSSESSLTSDKGLQKRQKSFRKRGIPQEDDTEKENVIFSKADVKISCPVKGDMKFQSDKNNNECNDSEIRRSSKPTTSKKSKINSAKAKPSSITPISTSVAAPLSNKPPTTEFKHCQERVLPLQQCGVVGRIKSKNIYHQYVNSFIGKSVRPVSEPVSCIIANQLSNYEVADNDHPFQCRITSIEWHPRKRNFLGVGSKHGDMAFFNVKSEDYSRLELIQKFAGIGPGGNIPSMKFHPSQDNLVYTASLCGKVSLHDIEGRDNRVLLNTMSWDFWYSSLDVHMTDFLVMAGKNKGGAALLDKDGTCIWEKRLHRQKISHLEFSQRDSPIFCTASLDHTVKIWDLRKVVEKMPLESIVHTKGLNSAYFSLTDGCRLLTTDQSEEIRIYNSPSWSLERTIMHPHRFFQHLTPIKAYWHPLKDIILCSRYPNVESMPEFRNRRCIDMFDAATGQVLGEIDDLTYNGITSLVKTNNEGTKLITSMGYNLNLWNSQDRNTSCDAPVHQVKMMEQSGAKVASKVLSKAHKTVSQRQKKTDKDCVRKKEKLLGK